MIIKEGKFKIAGLFGHDGYIDKATHTNAEISELILQRLHSLKKKRVTKKR